MALSIVEIQDVSRSMASRGLLAGQNAFTLGAGALKQAADYLGDVAARVKPTTNEEIVLEDAEQAEQAVPEDPPAKN